MTDVPSKSQVTKAGRRLRRAFSDGPGPPDLQDFNEALEVLIAFRAAHAGPLRKANMGPRSVVSTEGCRVEVSQRLKRIPTILDKLIREPTMALGNMGDIGGCRAVLDSVAEVRRVELRLRKNRPPVTYQDYVKTPKASGYRAVHLVVVYDSRRIEVQLRTRIMHEWAYTVERLSGRLGGDLKNSRGPEPVQAWLGIVSAAMALDEAGLAVDETMMAEVGRLREAAMPHLLLGGGRS